MRVFVTGASGHIASAVIPELLRAGHDVSGLARSEATAEAVASSGATVVSGSLRDLDVIRRAASQADGVIHLALFDGSRLRAGDMEHADDDGVSAVRAIGEIFAGTGKPLVTASAIGALGPLGRPSTEQDAPRTDRTRTENAVLDLAQDGIRAAVVRLPLITHSVPGRHGLAGALIDVARRTGVSGFAGDGANRWPAVHTLDAGRLFRLVLERAEAGTRWHAVHDEGIPLLELAQLIAEHLELPTASIAPDDLGRHFGFLSSLIALDVPSTSEKTQRALGWEPSHPRLLLDMTRGDYFETGPRASEAALG